MARVQDVEHLWWLWLIRGLVLVFFGIFAAVWPDMTLVLLAGAFALLLLVSGVIDLITGIIGFGKRHLWFLTILLGALQTGLGIFLLRHELVTLSVFIALIGIGLLVRGVLETVAAFDRGYDGGTKLLMVIVGIITVALGVIVLAHPASGGLAFMWALGVYGIIAGTVSVAMSLNLRSELDRLTPSRR